MEPSNTLEWILAFGFAIGLLGGCFGLYFLCDWLEHRKDPPPQGSLTLYRDGVEVAHDCVGPCERCGTSQPRDASAREGSE